ncbi:MAG: RnfABCDGE type electron transport complex subunit G [Muribaculaceae bacterium]|nr:RnfABCDGE type electron transport complex subunit G [Roseburia sp.]MCM1430428.1 RnfABCDGE type electron transport complex subunit G [Muribaculaceae bacterium]MCM1492376.1 RnfABCDGE type electron transport complex subunit G [Muribaculaceae bacterium]
MNKKIVHDALILTAFTLALGLILGVVYGITKEPIEAANAAATKAAYQAVFADAANFEPLEYDKDEANALVADAGYSDTVDDVETAFDADGNALGYVITVTAKDGSQGSITFSVGIAGDGTVNGYSITDIAETPGLGMKAEEEAFYSQFEGKKVSSFTVVKQTPAADNEIESITGSTITSKAMANGCNAAIYYFENALGGAGNE